MRSGAFNTQEIGDLTMNFSEIGTPAQMATNQGLSFVSNQNLADNLKEAAKFGAQ